MTTPAPQPIAFTTDGSPVFRAAAVPPGHPQPLATLADGQAVWPLPAGHIPADQPQPLGYLASGTYVYVQLAPPAPPVPPAPAPTPPKPAEPPYTPAAFTGPAYAAAAQPTRTTPVNPNVSWAPAQPAWKRKRVLIPAGGLALALAFSSLNGNDTSQTEIVNAGAEQAQVAGVKAKPVSQADRAAAARKAAADKAAAQKAAAQKAAAQRAAAEAREAAENGPADQRAFVKAVVTGRENFESTDNELKQRQFQKQRDAAALAAVRGLRVKDWVGEIRSIDTNGGGKGVLELRIGDDTKISTWNNAFSDYADNTLIPMESPMYEALVDMKEGDRIRFSGTFFRDDKTRIKETSLTLFGQMRTPNFLFRFSSIAPIS